jgi:hypothetical protein
LLRIASSELEWLLERGYPLPSSLVLVGNHHNLDSRQRLALQRSCCAESQQRDRKSRALGRDAVRGQVLHLDGFNVVVTLEVALGGGVVLRGSDGCLRDLAGLRGSYHLVDETSQVIEHMGVVLSELQPASCEVLLDSPVSNSGRLRALLQEQAKAWPFPTSVELVNDPDPVLAKRSGVASSDSMILDRCGAWANLTAWVVESRIPKAWVIDLHRA